MDVTLGGRPVFITKTEEVRIISLERAAARSIVMERAPERVLHLTGVGLQGVQGERGEKGDQGEQGIQGLKGETGDQGPIGLKGDTGEQGPQGIQGPRGFTGFQGLQGETGPQGEQGPVGADSTVPGPKGDQGDQGPIGPQGLKGDKGEKGDTGDTGGQGTQGPQGIQGPKGDTGDSLVTNVGGIYYLPGNKRIWTNDALDPSTFQLKTDTLAASRLTGTIDIARLPVLPSQQQFVSSGALTALTTAQQDAIGQGSVVTTTDGMRYIYSGTGSKTLAASYVTMGDISPEWTAIANKPTTFTPATHTHTFASLTSKPTTLAGFGITDALLASNFTYANLGGKPDLVVNGQFSFQAGGAGNGYALMAVGDTNVTGITGFYQGDGVRAGYIGNANKTAKKILFNAENGYSWRFSSTPDINGNDVLDTSTGITIGTFQTLSGRKVFKNAVDGVIGGVSYANLTLEVQAKDVDDDALMSFHIPGVRAGSFGLSAADGSWKVEAPNGVATLWHSRNFDPTTIVPYARGGATASISLFTSEGVRVGGLYGETNGNLGITDENGAWLLRSHPTYLSYRGSTVWTGANFDPASKANTNSLALQSQRDFADGTLVLTDLNYPAASGEPFLMEITGNSYGGSELPFDSIVQGYLYANTIYSGAVLHKGAPIPGMIATGVGGKLAFWWPRIAYWQGFTVKLVVADPGRGTANRVVSITNAVKPASVGEYSFTATARTAWNTSNFSPANYLPLSGGALNGNLFLNRTTPIFYMNDLGQTGALGRFRMYSAAGNFYFTRNTAVDGGWGTEGTIFRVSSSLGTVTMETPVSFSTTATFNSDATFNGGSILNTNWWRSSGQTGWFNSTYSTGIYATEPGVVRTYNGGSFVSEGAISATTGLFHSGGKRVPVTTYSQAAPSGGVDGDVHIVW